MSYLLLKESFEVDVLTETKDNKKQLKLEGIFAQAEVVNGNKRFYKRDVLEQSVAKYINEYVNKKRAVGELHHPDYPYPDIANAAILIEELTWDGNNVIGKAKVLDTPRGQIVRGLVEGGFNMGVSTRALGSITERNGIKYVDEGLIMTAVDCVDQPSGPDCYVNSLHEQLTESVWDYQNGVLIKKERNKLDESIMLQRIEDYVKSLKR